MKELKKKVQSQYDSVKANISQSMERFSVNLNEKHLDQAKKLLKEFQSNQEFKDAELEEPKLIVHASEIYKNSFTFPQIALNDYAAEQLQSLKNAESTLNQDLSNKLAMTTFYNTAHQVAENLGDHYQKQWVNPNDQGRNSKSAPQSLVHTQSYVDSSSAVTDYIDPGEKIESLTTVNFGDQAPEKA